MDLNRVLIFAKVVEYQSFTKAATELQMDKSTVSNKLSQLESQLGVRLLNRSTRSVTLTEAGEGYYRYCRQIVDTALDAEQFISTMGSDVTGLLRIAAPDNFGEALLEKIKRDSRRFNPNCKNRILI